MTEGEWLTCTDVLALLAEPTAHGEKAKRRLRLFSIACCRRLSRWIVNPRLLKCLEASERYADGKLKDSGLDHWTAEANKSWQAAEKSAKRIRNKAAVIRAHHAIAYTCLTDRYEAYGSAARIILGAEKEFGKPFVEEMRSLFPRLFRDVFPNPYRPIRFDPAWRTATVARVAGAIYADQGWDEMPILADALEEAGCSEGKVLAHCREPGTLVRGCWVVDWAKG
jgi:hypothetical protein